VLFERVEEGLDHLAFARVVAVDEGMHAQAYGIAENSADHQHPLKVQRHEAALTVLLALFAPRRIHPLVGGMLGVVAQQSKALDVGDGFDVENEDRPAHPGHFNSA
jgi:hypothetical protein